MIPPPTDENEGKPQLPWEPRSQPVRSLKEISAIAKLMNKRTGTILFTPSGRTAHFAIPDDYAKTLIAEQYGENHKFVEAFPEWGGETLSVKGGMIRFLESAKPPASEAATPTPETDAKEVDAVYVHRGDYVPADFARSLERRLTEAFKRVDEQFTEIQNLQSLHLKAFKESERLESDLLLARQQGQEMRGALHEIIRVPVGGIAWLQMRDIARNALAATPSPQGNKQP